MPRKDMISRNDIIAAKAPLGAFVVVGFAWGGFAALVPDLKAHVAASDSDFGMAMFVAALGALAAMWLAPRVEARLGARALVALSAALAALYLLPGLVGSVAAFAGAMLLVSAASGTLDVTMNARLSSIEGQRGRPLMNFAHATFSFAYAIAAVIAGVVREQNLPPLVAFALLGCASLLMCLVIRRDVLPQDDNEAEETSNLPLMLLVLTGGVILIAFMSEQATEAWSALHLERSLGAGAMEGAFGPALLGLTMGLGRMGGQALAHRFPPLAVIALAALVAAMGAFLAAFATMLSTAYFGFILLGFGVSVTAPTAFAYVGAKVSQSSRSRAISRVAVIGYTGFFIGPPMMGFLSEGFGLRVAFAVIAICLTMIALGLVPSLTALNGRNDDD